MATVGSKPFLYAANFRNSVVDVFDADFHFVTNTKFRDPGIPSDFGPFDIRNIGGLLYVTFAKHKPPDNMDDLAGPGNGYIDIFTPEGRLVRRFASQGKLNSPWGLAEVRVGWSGFRHWAAHPPREISAVSLRNDTGGRLPKAFHALRRAPVARCNAVSRA